MQLYQIRPFRIIILSNYLYTNPARPFPICSLDHIRSTHGTPVGKFLALRTHHQLPHTPSSMSRILCSKGSSSVSFCCSGSSALSDSGCCCCSGSPPLFGSRCPASAPASGSPLASVSLDVLLRLLQSTLHQLPFAVAHPYPSWNLLPTALHH